MKNTLLIDTSFTFIHIALLKVCIMRRHIQFYALSK